MDNFIKKIFEGKEVDELVHSQFTKFSKGEFPARAMIRARNSSGKYTISTTAEYAKDIIMFLAEKLGDKPTQINGAIISALDLEGFEYDERKMAMGVRKYMIYDKEMTGNQIIDLCNKIDKAFFALSFISGDTTLTIKPKSPKSAKGVSSEKKKDKKAKIDFIKIKTTDKELADNLIFDDEAQDFKKIEIKHDIIINNIIFPENEKDFAKIREMAKRKGKIIRKLDIDGKEVVKEAEFEA
tara:strand:+ start:6319 stop:7038 length:720 start_codon:yes stop_codon:yes gene_type:complete